MTLAEKSPICLRVVPGLYGVVKLAHDAQIPKWSIGPGMSAIIRADDELTLVCQQERIPHNLDAALNWRCLRSVGPFSFDACGIVLSIIAPLSTCGIGVFVICTYDGEHILISDRHWKESHRLLKEAGHTMVA